MEEKKFSVLPKLVLLFGDIGIAISVYAFVTTVILVRVDLIGNFGLYQGILPVQIILMGLLFNINGWSVSCRSSS